MPVMKVETGRGLSIGNNDTFDLTNTTSETTILSYIVKGRSLSTSRKLRFTILMRMSTGTVSLPTLTVKLKFGSATMTIASAVSLALGVADKPVVIEGMIANLNATNSQIAFAKLTQFANSLPLISANGVSMEETDWSVDTTIDQPLLVTAQFGGLAIGTSLSFRYADLEIL